MAIIICICLLDVMLTYFIKFLHVFIALGLLGLTVVCFALAGPHNLNKILRINKILLILTPFALITGTLLVYPKQYTFHTPWIMAAYGLLGVFCSAIILALFLQEKIAKRWVWKIIYFLLLGILTMIVHDAVTKTSFL